MSHFYYALILIIWHECRHFLLGHPHHSQRVRAFLASELNVQIGQQKAMFCGLRLLG
jgi:hypothetical protein